MSEAKVLEVIEKQDLEQMHTGTLLKRLDNLRKLDESFEKSDWTNEERLKFSDQITFKNTQIDNLVGDKINILLCILFTHT